MQFDVKAFALSSGLIRGLLVLTGCIIAFNGPTSRLRKNPVDAQNAVGIFSMAPTSHVTIVQDA